MPMSARPTALPQGLRTRVASGFARGLGTHVACLHQGRLGAEGPPAGVLTRPRGDLAGIGLRSRRHTDTAGPFPPIPRP